MELAEYMGKRRYQPAGRPAKELAQRGLRRERRRADLRGVADHGELNSASPGDFEVGQGNPYQAQL